MAEPSVTIEVLGPRGMIALRGDVAAEPIARAAREAAGVAVPGRRGIAFDGARGLAWMAPDELMIFCPREDAAATLAGLRSALADTPHLLADVSAARARFALEGAGARAVLAKGAPVDLARFAQGEIRRTRLGQVAVAFWMTGPEAFELVCFRSLAAFVGDWLALAAADEVLPDLP